MRTDDKNIIIPDFIIILKAIETLRYATVLELFEETKITLCHIYKIKDSLIKKQWISIKEEGDKKYLSLTDKGKNVVTAANILLEQMNISNELIKHYRTKYKNKKTKTKEIK